MLPPQNGNGHVSRFSSPLPLEHASPIAKVLAALGEKSEVKPHGKGWRCCCPAHDDNNPSLDIGIGADHKVLVICRSGGCSLAQIAQVIGLSPRDFFNGSMPDKLPMADRIQQVYCYKDEKGRTLFETVRLLYR